MARTKQTCRMRTGNSPERSPLPSDSASDGSGTESPAPTPVPAPPTKKRKLPQPTKVRVATPAEAVESVAAAKTAKESVAAAKTAKESVAAAKTTKEHAPWLEIQVKSPYDDDKVAFTRQVGVPTCNVGRDESDRDPLTGNHLLTRGCLCSRRQCQIKKHADPSKFAVLIDTSMNDTKLNDVRIPPSQECELQHGDTIDVGLDPDDAEWVSTTFLVYDLRA
jgi:hypothetical protein